jgi:hypothetical protein
MVAEVSGIAELSGSGLVVTEGLWEAPFAGSNTVVTPMKSVSVTVVVPLLIVWVKVEQEKGDD